MPEPANCKFLPASDAAIMLDISNQIGTSKLKLILQSQIEQRRLVERSRRDVEREQQQHRCT